MLRLRSVQILRAVAACSVVGLHAYGPTIPGQISVVHFGAAGVDLFFVISGFIMATVARGKTAGEFLIDRALRIYPLWWLAALPWLLVGTHSLPKLVSTLTLWPAFTGGFYGPALGVGWTLTFEMMFYVAIALALLTRPIVPLLIYAVLLPLTFIINISVVNFLGSPMVLEFLLGIAVARLPKIGKPGLLLIVMAGLLFSFSDVGLHKVAVALHPASAFGRVLQWGVPAALLLYGMVGLEGYIPKATFIVTLGDASYAIYLFHTLLIYGLGLPWLSEFVLSIAFGLAMHSLVERRLLKWKRDRSARQSWQESNALTLDPEQAC